MEIIINVVESIATAFFISSLLIFKIKEKLLFSIALSLVLFITVCFFNYMAVYEKFYIIIYCLLIIIFSKLFAYDSYQFLVLLVLYLLGISSLSTIISYISFCIFFNTSIFNIIQEHRDILVFVGIFKQIILIVIFIKSSTLITKFHNYITEVNTLLTGQLLILNIIIIVIENIIFTKTFHESELVFSILFIILIFISTIILTFKLHQTKLKFQRLNIENENLSNQLSFSKINDKKNIEILTMIHDFKNSLIIMRNLLEQEKYSEVMQTVDNKISFLYENETEIFNTDFPYINAILNNKFYLSKQNGLLLVTNIQINQLSNYSEEELSIIISNLLDNAIENSEKGNSIFLVLKNINSSVYISVNNPVRDNFDINNDLISKKKGELHGLGILSIQHILNKKNGTISMYVENGEFYVKIIC